MSPEFHNDFFLSLQVHCWEHFKSSRITIWFGRGKTAVECKHQQRVVKTAALRLLQSLQENCRHVQDTAHILHNTLTQCVNYLSIWVVCSSWLLLNNSQNSFKMQQALCAILCVECVIIMYNVPQLHQWSCIHFWDNLTVCDIYFFW